MSITLIVNLVARSESIDEIAKVMEQVKVYLPKIDGCESVRICRGLDDAAEFTRHLAKDPVSTDYTDF